MMVAACGWRSPNGVMPSLQAMGGQKLRLGVEGLTLAVLNEVWVDSKVTLAILSGMSFFWTLSETNISHQTGKEHHFQKNTFLGRDMFFPWMMNEPMSIMHPTWCRKLATCCGILYVDRVVVQHIIWSPNRSPGGLSWAPHGFLLGNSDVFGACGKQLNMLSLHIRSLVVIVTRLGNES